MGRRTDPARNSEVGDVIIDGKTKNRKGGGRALLSDFVNNFLGARTYPYAFGTASANEYRMPEIKARSAGKGLDLLAWRF